MTAALVALMIAGCSQILGLEDPRGAPRDGDVDGHTEPGIDGTGGTPDAPPSGGPSDAAVACSAQMPCPADHLCDVGAPVPESLECRRIGTVPVGGLCTERSDCDAAGSCFRGACRTLCTAPDACATMERACVLAVGELRLCDTPCSMLAIGAEDSCGGAGRACAFVFGPTTYTACVARTLYGAGGNGAKCQQDADCKPGHLCDTGFDNVCRPYCDRQGGNGCFPGVVCQPRYPALDFYIEAYGTRYGVCREPRDM